MSNQDGKIEFKPITKGLGFQSKYHKEEAPSEISFFELSNKLEESDRIQDPSFEEAKQVKQNKSDLLLKELETQDTMSTSTLSVDLPEVIEVPNIEVGGATNKPPSDDYHGLDLLAQVERVHTQDEVVLKSDLLVDGVLQSPFKTQLNEESFGFPQFDQSLVEDQVEDNLSEMLSKNIYSRKKHISAVFYDLIAICLFFALTCFALMTFLFKGIQFDKFAQTLLFAKSDLGILSAFIAIGFLCIQIYWIGARVIFGRTLGEKISKIKLTFNSRWILFLKLNWRLFLSFVSFGMIHVFSWISKSDLVGEISGLGYSVEKQ